ncbi:MAG: hypothetical protein D6814_00340, partial [Calditrichaeota bacterium]
QKIPPSKQGFSGGGLFDYLHNALDHSKNIAFYKGAEKQYNLFNINIIELIVRCSVLSLLQI